jgi:cytochrome c oxidase subunit 2
VTAGGQGTGLRHRPSGGEVTARRLTAGLLALLLLAGAAVWILGRRADGAVDLTARQPAAGGWAPERIVVHEGERVRLRIRSEDVVHGFAIGRLGVDAGPIEPGKVKIVEFVASRPGEYTFYCTEWCDPSHPRMRGILEVRGPDAAPGAARPLEAGVPHTVTPRDALAAPPDRPAASRGAPPYQARCATCHGPRGEGTPGGPPVGDRDFLFDKSPAQAFLALRADGPASRSAHLHGAGDPGKATAHAPYTAGWNDQQTWDVVAHLWALGTSPERLEAGQRVFARNCAACHGERGAGDGPGGKHQPKAPANFTDPQRMLSGSSAIYLATIRRGGMGSGMPYWGNIFTEDEMRSLVDIVWSFSLGTRE